MVDQQSNAGMAQDGNGSFLRREGRTPRTPHPMKLATERATLLPDAEALEDGVEQRIVHAAP